MGAGASKKKAAEAAPPGEGLPPISGQPQLQECDSPRVGESYQQDEKLLELRASVGKSLKSLEEKLEAKSVDRQGPPLIVKDLEDLKESLSAVEDGVLEAQAKSARALKEAVYSGKEALRKSAHETATLSVRFANQRVALEGLQEQVARLRGDRERIRSEMQGLVRAQSAAIAEIQTRQTQLLQAGPPPPDPAIRFTTERLRGQHCSQPQVEELQRQLQEARQHAQQMRELAVNQFFARREVSSRLAAAQGPLRVMCRVRPPLLSEDNGKRAASKAVRTVGADGVMVTALDGTDKMYRLDRVLSPSEGQPEVCHEVLPLIEAAVDGNSAAVVLYGPRNSGKAFTAIGTVSEPGLFLLALGEVFNLVGERSGMQDFSVGLSILEISDSATWDYLGHDGTSPGPAGEEVSPVFVQTLPEAMQLQDLGLRAVEQGPYADIGPSSLLFTIFVTATNRLTGEETSGKLQIVQVATSSARGSQGAPSSVVLLGECIISSLKHHECSWNNCVLTHLLRDSLALPAARAIVLITVPPSAKDSRETVAALNFASRCFNATPQGAKLRAASAASAIEL